VLSLEMALSSSIKLSNNEIGKNLSTLKKLCENDELVLSTIDSIPLRVYTDGVKSLPELQVRFQVLKDEVK
jgi:uncharacterized protein Smg (DUF494 family)